MTTLGSFDGWITADIPPDMAAPKPPQSITAFDTQLAATQEWWWAEPFVPDVVVVSAPQPIVGHQAFGVTVEVWTPSFGTVFLPTAVRLGLFDWETYEHTLAVGLGYDSMNCAKACNWEEAYHWLGYGLGAHVQATDDAGVTIWEGRVNQVQVSAAGLSVSKGPLQDVGNRVVVTYQLKVDASDEGQEQKRTDPGNNLTSQARYGICYQTLSGGSTTTARANQIRDAYLALNAWPRMPKELSLGGGDVRVTLNCLGYAHWLNYPYRYVTSKAMTTVSAKLAAVLAASPNGFFGGGNIITTNALAVPGFEDTDKTAADIIGELVNLGDAALNRYLFGIWANRIVRYEAAPTTTEYQQRTDDPRQVVENMHGHVVNPWAVRPGKWLAFSNLGAGSLVGRTGPGLPEEERTMFIESVQFRAPYGLTLSGGVVNDLVQALAQWGIGSI
jgi:hypothetical protein